MRFARSIFTCAVAALASQTLAAGWDYPFTVNQAQSTLTFNATLALGPEDNDVKTSPISGTMLVNLAPPPGNFNSIRITQFDFSVVNTLNFSFDFGFLGSGTATLQQGKLQELPSFGTPPAAVSVNSNGNYSQPGHRIAADGNFNYNTTTASGSGSADLDDSARITRTLAGQVTTSGSQITLTINSLNWLFDIEEDGTDIGDLQITGNIVATAPLLKRGDSDGDGDVDLNDLSNLAAAYGVTTNGQWGQGDFDSDGDIDLNDLSSLAANYGTGEAAAFADFQALAAVPEPAALGLLALGGTALVRRHVNFAVRWSYGPRFLWERGSFLGFLPRTLRNIDNAGTYL